MSLLRFIIFTSQTFLASSSEIKTEVILECVRKINDYFYKDVTIYAYNNQSEFGDGIAKIILEQQTYVLNINDEFRFDHHTTYNGLHMINTNNIAAIETYFNKMYLNPKFGLSAMVLLIHAGDFREINIIFDIVRRLRVQRAVLLSKTNDLFTFEPFRENCGKYTQTELLCDCTFCDLRVVEGIFKSKFRMLNGCEVRVYAFKRPPFVIDVHDEEMPGIEAKMILETAMIYNFTVNFVPHNYTTVGFIYADGTFSGMFEGFYNNEADVMLGNVRRNSNYIKYFEATTNYIETEYSFYVQSSTRKPHYLIILHTFSLEVWLLIIASVISVAPIFWAYARFCNEERYKTYKNSAFCIFATFLSKSVKKPRSTPLRVIFIAWVLCSYMILSAHESLYFSHQIKLVYNQEINSIRELVNAGYKFGGGLLSKGIFYKYNGEEYFKEIYENWIDCIPTNQCVDLVLSRDDFAGMENSLSVKYNEDNYVGENNRIMIHPLPRIITGQYWMVVNRGFPVKTQLDKAIVMLTEHGYLTKWEKQAVPVVPAEIITYYSPVGMDRIKLAFFVLFVGLTLGFFSFVAEIYHGRKLKDY